MATEVSAAFKSTVLRPNRASIQRFENGYWRMGKVSHECQENIFYSYMFAVAKRGGELLPPFFKSLPSLTSLLIREGNSM